METPIYLWIWAQAKIILYKFVSSLFSYFHTSLCECVPRDQIRDNQTILNTFNQPQVLFWLKKMGTKNMHLATRILHLVAKRWPTNFF